ncbi:ArnT family glycosyltransferase [Chloroflexota bacterium]
MRKMIGQRWWWLAGWLVLQVGGVLGSVLNWQPDPAYLLWSGLALAGIILVGLLIVTLPLSNVIGWRQRWALSPIWILPVAGAFLVLWALPLQPAFPLDALRWTLTTLAAGLLALLVRGPVGRGIWRWSFVALVILLLWFSLATLMVYPEIYTDEGLNLNHALTSAHAGPIYKINFYLGIFGDPQRIDAEVIWWPVGLFLQVIGLGLWQGRLTLWLFLPFTVGLIYLATYRLYRSLIAGVGAALFFAASTLTLYAAHFIRQEIVLCFVLALALWLHAYLEEKPRFGLAFLLGLVVSLAVDVHPNAFVFCFAFGALYMGRYVGAVIRQRRLVYDVRLVGLIAGGSVGALSYFMLHIAADPVDFIAQVTHHYNHFGSTHSADNDYLRTLLLRLVTAVNHFRSYYAFSLVEGSVISLALCAGLFSRQKTGRLLAVLFLLCLGGWLVMGSSFVPIYAAIMLPLAAVLVGGLLLRLPQLIERWALVLIILAAMIGVSVRAVNLAEQEGFNRQFQTCLDELSEQLPADAMIFGEHLYWLARPDLSDRYAARTLVEWPWPTRTAAEWWAWLDPDIVLWPGPINATGYAYVSEQGYTYHELAACPTSHLMIWLKPGVELRGEG